MHLTWFRRSSSLVLTLLLGALAGSGTTASGAVGNRLSGAIRSDTARVALSGSVHGRVKTAADLGSTDGSTKLEGMTLRFSLTAAQEAALDQLLEDQQNPSSTRYHQWLTPEQYGAQFGLSSADLDTVKAWLTAQGFTVTEVARSGTYVRFNGTAAQAEAAFATSIHNVSVDGVTVYANVTEASLPAQLAGVVSGITGLHNIRLKARVRSRAVQLARFTSSISGNHYIAPGDFYTIYNETPVLTAGTSGAGVSIAIMGQIDIKTSDISAFRTASGLAASTITQQLYGSDPGSGYSCSSSSSSNCPSPNLDDLAESSLDVEWSGAVAPGATIIFVKSTDVIGTSLTDAIDNNLAPIMSVSYGDCESSWGSSSLISINQLFKQASAQGITVVGPAGDSGATDCDYSSSTATNGLAVDFPASSPYVTAMGGTMYNEGSSTGGTSYWLGTDSTITAGAYVTAATYSAQSYLPEAVWNEDTSGSSFSAGGGGPSNFFTKPAWQVGTGVPSDASRDVPDLALNSAASHDGYLYCANGSCTNGGFRASDGQTLTVGGGTSFATPSFAGILALVEQKTGSRIGSANPTIYAMGNSVALYNSTTSSVFHDITTGNNNSPCTAGTADCPNGGTIGYSAGTGYDLATGWGSVNVYNFVNAWASTVALSSGSNGSNTSTTTLSVSPSSVTAGATITFTANVTGSAGTPTGTVQFLVGNTAVGSPVTLSSGVATYSYVTSCSTLGTRSVEASYSGKLDLYGIEGRGISVNGSSTVSPIQITVNSGSCPDFTLTPSSSAKTVTSGNPNVTLTVAPLNGFTGTVSFSASATETSSTVPTFSFNPSTVTISSTASATTTLTLSNVTAELRAPELPRGQAPWLAAGSGATLASLLVLVLPRRRRLGGLLLVVLMAGLAAGATGCSTGNSTITANSNTGTYTVTVTATYTGTSGTISHSTQVTFTVQ